MRASVIVATWALTGSYVSEVVRSGVVTEATRRSLSQVTLVTMLDQSVLLVNRLVVAL